MRESEPVQFGDYLLYDRIGIGGMAEIFLASSQGIEGFEKRLVIKRILPNLSNDDQFVRMFVEEAKLCASLRHPNIVQVYDLGEIDKQFFIAMEFVDGRDLLKTLSACGQRELGFPTDIALYIVMETLKGLQYAHQFKGADGMPLGIIHRDVSPSNVFLSFQGQVKIGDFGIAKASTREQTQAGILKGKFGYMAPEQVAGTPIDHRADIFATGIVLFELLAGNRLFSGPNDLAVLQKVREAVIEPPLTDYRSDLDAELIDIVMKALGREAEDRFQSAEAMRRALADYAYRRQASVAAPELARFLQSLFLSDPDEQVRRSKFKLPPIRVSYVGIQPLPDFAPASTRDGDVCDASGPVAPPDAWRRTRPGTEVTASEKIAPDPAEIHSGDTGTADGFDADLDDADAPTSGRAFQRGEGTRTGEHTDQTWRVRTDFDGPEEPDFDEPTAYMEPPRPADPATDAVAVSADGERDDDVDSPSQTVPSLDPAPQTDSIVPVEPMGGVSTARQMTPAESADGPTEQPVLEILHDETYQTPSQDLEEKTLLADPELAASAHEPVSLSSGLPVRKSRRPRPVPSADGLPGFGELGAEMTIPVGNMALPVEAETFSEPESSETGLPGLPDPADRVEPSFRSPTGTDESFGFAVSEPLLSELDVDPAPAAAALARHLTQGVGFRAEKPWEMREPLLVDSDGDDPSTSELDPGEGEDDGETGSVDMPSAEALLPPADAPDLHETFPPDAASSHALSEVPLPHLRDDPEPDDADTEARGTGKTDALATQPKAKDPDATLRPPGPRLHASDVSDADDEEPAGEDPFPLGDGPTQQAASLPLRLDDSHRPHPDPASATLRDPDMAPPRRFERLRVKERVRQPSGETFEGLTPSHSPAAGPVGPAAVRGDTQQLPPKGPSTLVWLAILAAVAAICTATYFRIDGGRDGPAMVVRCETPRDVRIEGVGSHPGVREEVFLLDPGTYTVVFSEGGQHLRTEQVNLSRKGRVEVECP